MLRPLLLEMGPDLLQDEIGTLVDITVTRTPGCAYGRRVGERPRLELGLAGPATAGTSIMAAPMPSVATKRANQVIRACIALQEMVEADIWLCSKRAGVKLPAGVMQVRRRTGCPEIPKRTWKGATGKPPLLILGVCGSGASRPKRPRESLSE